MSVSVEEEGATFVIGAIKALVLPLALGATATTPTTSAVTTVGGKKMTQRLAPGCA